MQLHDFRVKLLLMQLSPQKLIEINKTKGIPSKPNDFVEVKKAPLAVCDPSSVKLEDGFFWMELDMFCFYLLSCMSGSLEVECFEIIFLLTAVKRAR